MINNKESCEIGIIGLGTMGRNLLLNMADHGFTVAGYDKDPEQVKNLRQESIKHTIYDTADIKSFIQLLRLPRAVMLLVPSGPIVDSVIQEILPLLEPGDLIIDAGNSYFEDTDTRTHTLQAKQINFFGMGISGGEYGARHGPSIMPGGSKEAYNRIHLILEAIAAKVNGEPCVTYLGPGSSGHFVKMIHNGIEYGIMQLISETYHLMKLGFGLSDDQLHEIYSKWNKGELNSYLIEITSHIFEQVDIKTGNKLINNILDVAKQNGTGMWTAKSALELQVPAPTIEMAVTMRDLSALQNERIDISAIYHRSIKPIYEIHHESIADLHNSLYMGMIITFAQGMSLLKVGSDTYKYNLELEAVARIWRGGCIIRAKFLEDISAAFRDKSELSNLLLAPNFSPKLKQYESSFRKSVTTATMLGIPIPGFMSALGYLDAFSSNWLPANLIQAQRDYFGSHQYERIDMQGTFHTEWRKT